MIISAEIVISGDDLRVIDLLTQHPPVGDIKPMQGMNGMYRLRCGKYRVIYGFCDGKLEIMKVGARGDIYIYK